MIKKNKYTEMQRTHYENTAPLMNQTGNHRHHDANPDYWDILLGDWKTKDSTEGKKVFEFGLGQGRNIINCLNLGFHSVDGCDISSENIKYAEKNILKEYGTLMKSRLFVTNGVEINGVDNDMYDFVFSTIVMQHICVYEIRYSILKEKYRILKSGGLLSFQMGFDNCKHGKYQVEYKDNYYDATGTNGFCDVMVQSPDEIIQDLKSIGFKNIEYWIRPAFSDEHHNWIFVKAYK